MEVRQSQWLTRTFKPAAPGSPTPSVDSSRRQSQSSEAGLAGEEEPASSGLYPPLPNPNDLALFDHLFISQSSSLPLNEPTASASEAAQAASALAADDGESIEPITLEELTGSVVLNSSPRPSQTSSNFAPLTKSGLYCA